jgi:antitoxin component HigA of HigAB toxin-antitoxin module
MSSTYKLARKAKDSYMKCCKKFPLFAIKNARHLDAAHEVIEELLEVQMDKGQEAYLNTLSGLVADYEDQNIDFGGKTTPVEMLAHLMEARGVSNAELAHAINIGRSTVSDILSERVGISKSNALKIGDYFGVDPVFFLRELAIA